MTHVHINRLLDLIDDHLTAKLPTFPDASCWTVKKESVSLHLDSGHALKPKSGQSRIIEIVYKEKTDAYGMVLQARDDQGVMRRLKGYGTSQMSDKQRTRLSQFFQRAQLAYDKAVTDYDVAEENRIVGIFLD